MIKFTHIDGFHLVARYGKKFIHEPVEYRGSVKLHGTNSSVVCTPEKLQPQSRNRELDIDKDNMGFAHFVLKEEQQKIIRHVEKAVRSKEQIPHSSPLTLFGEWIGLGIQSGVAVNQLPHRQWVLFGCKAGEQESTKYIDIMNHKEILDVSKNYLEQPKIYCVYNIPHWTYTIDFQNTALVQKAVEDLEKLTQEVEDCCPWGKFHGIKGMGEGIVWTPVGKHYGNSDLFFKTKGEKHKNVTKAKRNLSSIDPEVIKSVDEFLNFALTENRLNQGIEYLKEMNHEISVRSTGEMLKWVGQDIKRECRAELLENDLNWKQVSKELNARTRSWFHQKCVESE